jgi:hypothetical protein
MQLSTVAKAVGTMIARRTGHVTIWLPAIGLALRSGGEDENGKVSDDAELIDVRTGTSVATGKMTTPRAHHAGCLLHDGRVLLSGAILSDGTYSDTCEYYYPTPRTLELSLEDFARDRDHYERLGSTVEKLRNAPDGPVVKMQVHRPGGIFIAGISGLSSPRVGHSMLMLPTGDVLVLGGKTSGNVLVDRFELYRPAAPEESRDRAPF